MKNITDILNEVELKIRLMHKGILRAPRLMYEHDEYGHFRVYEDPVDVERNRKILARHINNSTTYKE